LGNVRIPPVFEYGPPRMSRLEELAVEVWPETWSFEETCEWLRGHLRREIQRALRDEEQTPRFFSPGQIELNWLASLDPVRLETALRAADVLVA